MHHSPRFAIEQAGTPHGAWVAAGPARAVLDTNATLDWLVFHDGRMAALAAAIEGGQVQWIASARMREELAHVLSHPRLLRWQPDVAAVLAHFDGHAQMAPAPAPAPPGLRCSDETDQVFIDLALACGATWLVSHDKAVRRLARAAARRGLRILPPGGWRADEGP